MCGTQCRVIWQEYAYVAVCRDDAAIAGPDKLVHTEKQKRRSCFVRPPQRGSLHSCICVATIVPPGSARGPSVVCAPTLFCATAKREGRPKCTRVGSIPSTHRRFSFAHVSAAQTAAVVARSRLSGCCCAFLPPLRMFHSMFMNRFASYHQRADSSDDEEQTSAGFTLRREGAGGEGGAGNTALQTALDSADPSAGRIALETEVEDGMDMDAAVAETLKHLCIECRDQPAMLTCDQCTDRFCDVCFAALHKRGTRAAHTHKPYTGGQQVAAIQALALGATAKPAAAAAGAEVPGSMEDEEEKESKAHSVGSPELVAPSSSSSAAATAPSAAASSASPASPSADDDEVSDDLMLAQFQKANGAARGSHAGGASDGDSSEDDDNRSAASGASSRSRGIVLPSNAMNSSLVSGDASAAAAGSVPRLLANGLPVDWFSNRARYIPLRLTLEERKFLRLLEATLNVSEYTDKIDIVSNKDKMTRIKEQLRDLCSILSGLVVSSDYKLGQKLIKDKEFSDNAAFFGNVFELGRRHKIRNPEKMRNTYGKLTYIIQDSVNPAISELMGFDLYAPLKTVYRELEAAGALACLTDERLMIATGDIKTEGRQRPEIERDIKQKENAVTYLARRYMNDKINEDGMRACILSIADNHTFLIQNRHCCDTMLAWLTELYPADEARTPAHSLAILGGRAGARLTHSHASQYSYVLQSLTLWREILHDMSVRLQAIASCFALGFMRRLTHHSFCCCCCVLHLLAFQVPSLGVHGGGSVRRVESLPSAQHRARFEPRAVRPTRRQVHAQHSLSLSTQIGKLGGIVGHPSGRSQRAERAQLHRQVHTVSWTELRHRRLRMLRSVRSDLTRVLCVCCCSG